MKPLDVLIVGAGPAGLAAAIRLRAQLDRDGRDASVVVIDKAPGSGYHNLSGAAFEPDCLEELLPGWQDERSVLTDHATPVQRDQMYFLAGRFALRIPPFVVPRRMHHRGDVTLSLKTAKGKTVKLTLRKLGQPAGGHIRIQDGQQAEDRELTTTVDLTGAQPGL